MQDVPALLDAWSQGDARAFDALVPLVYDDLRKRARAYLRRERSDHMLQTTALVHEAYLTLVNQDHAHWKNRGQFMAVASHVMRRILVDHARRRSAAKRNSGELALTLSEPAEEASALEADILALDGALERLAILDPRQARIVELRYFAGLGIEETAAAINSSTATVKREWRSARAWLFHALTNDNSK